MRYAVTFIEPLRERGSYKCVVQIWDNFDEKHAENQRVVWRIAGRPDIVMTTDSIGSATVHITTPNSTTLYCSAAGQNREFPIDGFAHASTNATRPTDTDIRGNIFSAMLRNYRIARQEKKKARGR